MTKTTRPNTANPASADRTGPRRLPIDLLYLDLHHCTRCRETDRHLEDALAEVAQVLSAAGVEIDVRKIHIQYEDQARQLGFVSSPTLRINGRDIALDLKESACESCGDVCGEEGVACRVWTFQGQEYTAAPKAMIVDAVLRAVYGASDAAPATDLPPREVPENLTRFFVAKRRKDASGSGVCCP